MRTRLLLCLLIAACAPKKSADETPGPTGPTSAASPPSSDDLIAAAVAAGTISAQTGIVYRVFADFGDERLPEAYRSHVAGRCGTGAIDAAARSDLSAETTATLAPFLLPPSAPGSWRYLATIQENGITPGRDDVEVTWTKVSAQGGKITVWSEDRYAGDAALAQQIASEIDSRIWPKLVTDLGMREPLSDANHFNNGGTGSVDIYVVRQGQNGSYGKTEPYAYNDACGGADAMAAYMLINASVAVGPQLNATVTHELMHVLQRAYENPCDSFWWREATGTWAEDFVYPDANTEHEKAPQFFEELDRSLETQATYAQYVFPFFVQRAYGKSKIVPKSFELGESTLSPLPAIAGALTAVVGQSFEQVWPEFAKRNWNQGSVTDYYDWDGLALMPLGSHDTLKIGDVESP